MGVIREIARRVAHLCRNGVDRLPGYLLWVSDFHGQVEVTHKDRPILQYDPRGSNWFDDYDLLLDVLDALRSAMVLDDLAAT